MKKVFKIMSCALLAVTLTGCGNNPTPSNGNETVVSFSESDFKISVDDLYKSLKERYATNYLIQQIDQEILNKEYKTDSDADAYVENQLKILKLYYENSDSKLQEALQSAGYKNIDEYKEVIVTNYKRDLATKDYVKKDISEDDIKKYYDNNVYGEITVSHILVKLESSDNLTDEEKKEAETKANDKIKEIYDKLKEGKTFEEIAKEYSEDAATSSDGGKIGTFTKNEMTKKFNQEFEDAAMALEVGKYTEKAVKSSYGYHIIYKNDEKEKPSLEESKDSILDTLADEKIKDDTKAQYKALIELRKKYGLTFNDDDVKSQYDTAVNNWLYGKDSD